MGAFLANSYYALYLYTVRKSLHISVSINKYIFLHNALSNLLALCHSRKEKIFFISWLRYLEGLYEF